MALVRWLPRNRRRAVIVRVDAIGDFVLWLPYARRLVDHLHGSGKELVLIYSGACRDVADGELSVERTVAVRPHRFRTHAGYRRPVLWLPITH